METLDSIKKSTRTRIPKYIFFEDTQDNDPGSSVKQHKKKKKKDKKEIKKKIRFYDDDKEYGDEIKK